MKRKLLIHNLGVLITILLSVIAILAEGSTYSLHTRFFTPESPIEDIEVHYSNPGIVEQTDLYQATDSENIIGFKAIKRGITHVEIKLRHYYKNGTTNVTPISLDLEVVWPDLILDKTNGSFSGYDIAIYAIFFIMLFSEVIMLWIFIDCRRLAEYSYMMVTAGSLAIFNAILMMFALYKLLNNVVKTFFSFASIISDIGYQALVLLLPVMLISSVFLMISNIWLMRHEGRRPVNGLGIMFGLLWFAGTFFTLSSALIGFDFGLPEYVFRSGVYFLCYCECLFISTVVCSFLSVHHHIKPGIDYIIILGCGIRRDGSPTPLLKGRIDAAIEFEKMQFKKIKKHAIFVPSGGQGPDEVISESECMKNYLMSKNVPEEQILLEDKSTSTYENMKFSKAVIEKHCGNINDKKIAFSTTNYHIFRGYILSSKCGFSAKGLSAPTKTYFYPNAYLREFAGLIRDKWYIHTINITGVVVFFLLLNRLTD